MSIKHTISTVAINSGLSWVISTGITATQRGTAACIPDVIKSVGVGAINCLSTVGVAANYTSPLATITLLSTAGLNFLYGAWKNISDDGSMIGAFWYGAFGVAFSQVAYNEIAKYDQPCIGSEVVDICRDQLAQSVALNVLAGICLKAGLQRFSSKPFQSVCLLAFSAFTAWAVVLHGHAPTN